MKNINLIDIVSTMVYLMESEHRQSLNLNKNNNCLLYTVIKKNFIKETLSKNIHKKVALEILQLGNMGA